MKRRRRRSLSPVAAADSARDHGPKSGAIDTRSDVAVVVVISIRVQTRVVFLVLLEIRVTPDEKSNSG